jgi:hypothetical protein
LGEGFASSISKEFTVYLTGDLHVSSLPPLCAVVYAHKLEAGMRLPLVHHVGLPRALPLRRRAAVARGVVVERAPPSLATLVTWWTKPCSAEEA